MKKLIIPSKLNEGDTIAFLSISGGRAVDEDMIPDICWASGDLKKSFM